MKNTYRTVMLPLSALILLAGCMSVGPDYTPPSQPSSQFPASFGELPAGLAPGNVEVEWWRVFDEPALTALIQRALVANLDIGIAAVRLEEAQAMLRESRQGFLPRGGPRWAMRTAVAVTSKRRQASLGRTKPTAAHSAPPGKSISSGGSEGPLRRAGPTRALAKRCCAVYRRASLPRWPPPGLNCVVLRLNWPW